MTGIRVPDEDVVALLVPLKPGSSHTSAALHERYAAMMAAAGRPIASQIALSRALLRYGCPRRVVRKAKGRRGHQVRTDVPMFEAPGRQGGQPIDDEITALIRDMGPGLHPLDEIYRRYLCMPHAEAPMSRPALMARLGRRGIAEVRDRKRGQHSPGPLCRYFPMIPGF